MAQNATLWETGPARAVTRSRLGVGSAELPLDPGTVRRFLAKCGALDDRGHRWWLGAIDGRANQTREASVTSMIRNAVQHRTES